MARVRRPVNSPSGPSSEIKTIAVIGIVVLLGVAYWWANREAPAEGEGGDAAVSAAGSGTAAYAVSQPAHGPDTAKAVLVKFTDFQ